ncbi:MAG: hypothetical protein QOE89_926, partial [Pseudonocardiales bacterium]|nr:hypothetical protein [Pseudonocardiales bacterium]
MVVSSIPKWHRPSGDVTLPPHIQTSSTIVIFVYLHVKWARRWTLNHLMQYATLLRDNREIIHGR